MGNYNNLSLTGQRVPIFEHTTIKIDEKCCLLDLQYIPLLLLSVVVTAVLVMSVEGAGVTSPLTLSAWVDGGFRAKSTTRIRNSDA